MTMPISPITLQRRHAELGRIRLGHKAERGNPVKLAAFRFTSPSERYITDLAELYGGTAQAWDNNGKAEFEVFSKATSIPVIVVKGGLSQWMETWSGGGIAHRCDGERDVEGNLCDPADPKHQAAKPTTRLSVMLLELEAVGIFRMESHGWNAAAEIPAVAELAQFVGELVPANLNLVERRAIKDGKTSRFVVPVLDLQIGTARLRELVMAKSGGTGELGAGGGETPALQAPAAVGTEDLYSPYFERLAAEETVEECQALWTEMVGLKLLGTQATPSERLTEFIAAFKAKGTALTNPSAAEPDADGVVDGEIVEDEATIWNRILEAGGQRGMKLADIEDDFAAQMGGLTSGQATAAEMQVYLDKLLASSEPAA